MSLVNPTQEEINIFENSSERAITWICVGFDPETFMEFEDCGALIWPSMFCEMGVSTPMTK